MKHDKKILLLILSLFILTLGVCQVAASENIADDVVTNQEVNENILSAEDNSVISESESEIIGDDENTIVVDPVTKEYTTQEYEYTFKVHNNNQPVSGASFQVIIGYQAGEDFIGSYYGTTDSNGMGVVKINNPVIPVGVHGVEIDVYGDSVTSKYTQITVQEKNIPSTSGSGTSKVIKPIVKAPVVKVKFKAKKFFKVTVKNGNKLVKGLKLNVKVWTGKKVKTYRLTTNKKGVAKLSTKSLKVGTHKVKISSADSKYLIKKSSKIVVKKK